ncbi:hypothetical protein HK405_012070, partial [Cladochytrium tenue]
MPSCSRRRAASATGSFLRPVLLLLLASIAVVLLCAAAAQPAMAGGAASTTTTTTTTSSSTKTSTTTTQTSSASTVAFATTTTVAAASGTAATATPAATTTSLPRLAANSHFVVEAATNRTVFLHGVNIAAKFPPFRAIDTSSTSAIAAALDPLRAAGYNVVRLAFNWEAYEGSARGTYDASYLTYYKTLVVALRQRGIYTLVDFHQDAYARWLLRGCGEGFPQWAVPAAATQVTPANQSDAVDVKSKLCPVWGTALAFQEVIPGDMEAAFNGLMAPGSAPRAAFMEMVQTVSAALANETGVFGFDLINEPFNVTASFYEDAAAAVAAGGITGAVLLVEPASPSGNIAMPSGLSNVVYAPHHYDWRFILDSYVVQFKYWIQEGGITDPVNAFFDNATEATRAEMMTHFTTYHNVTSQMADSVSDKTSDGNVPSFVSSVSDVSGYVSFVDTQSKKYLASPNSAAGTIAKLLVLGTVDVLVALGDALL